MCVCVFFPFILDINGRTSRGHQTWRRSEGGRRTGKERTARGVGGSTRGLGPSPPLATEIPTGVGASANIEGIRGTSASVAPLLDTLRDLGGK